MNVLSLFHVHVYGRVKSITQGTECPHPATSGEPLHCKENLYTQNIQGKYRNIAVLPMPNPTEILIDNPSFKLQTKQQVCNYACLC